MAHNNFRPGIAHSVPNVFLPPRPQAGAMAQQPLGLNAFRIEGAYSDDEDGEEKSKIEVHVKAPTMITGDNNMVAIDTTLIASRISIAVVSALKQLGPHDIEMIDDDGAPRPVAITIDAEIRIHGAGNIIGEMAVLEAIKNNGLTAKREVSAAEAARINGEPVSVTLNDKAVSIKRERGDGNTPNADSKRPRHN